MVLSCLIKETTKITEFFNICHIFKNQLHAGCCCQRVGSTLFGENMLRWANAKSLKQFEITQMVSLTDGTH